MKIVSTEIDLVSPKKLACLTTQLSITYTYKHLKPKLTNIINVLRLISHKAEVPN